MRRSGAIVYFLMLALSLRSPGDLNSLSRTLKNGENAPTLLFRAPFSEPFLLVFLFFLLCSSPSVPSLPLLLPPGSVYLFCAILIESRSAPYFIFSAHQSVLTSKMG